MRKEHEDKVDPARPALIVLYGSTRKKVRPLEGELTVLGRAPGCDVGLVSPEVAPVHCVVVRLSSGWRIRDCSGRATRLNGKAITDEPLNNGDVIQVGTFSFEAHLPNAPVALPRGALAVATDPGRFEHLRQSRRRLGELALSLRRQLREQAAEVAQLQRREADLAQIERRAREAARQAHPGKSELEEARRQLDRRRSELDHYAAALRRQAQERQQERQPDAWADAELASQSRELRQQREELARAREQLRGREGELVAMVKQLQDTLTAEREELEGQRALVAAERAALDELREDLRRQRQELTRMQDDTVPGDRMPLTPSAREAQHDRPSGLEAARQLLRELAQRRHSAETKHDEPASRASEQVPAVGG